MGFVSEYKFQDVINEISAFSNTDIEVTSYNKHWFSSDALVTIDLGAEKTVPLEPARLQKFFAESKLQKINIRAHILHGPFIYYQNKINIAQAIIDASVMLNDEQNKLLQRTLSSPPIISMQMMIKINGRSIIDINVPPYVYESANRHIKWQNIYFGMEFSSSLHKIKRTIDIPEIQLEAPNFKLYLNSLKATYSGEKEADNLWLGDSAFSLKSFHFEITKVISGGTENFTTTSSFKEQKGLISGDTEINIDKLTVDDKNFTDNKIAWAISNFNMVSLAKLKQEISSLDSEEFALAPMKQASHFLDLLRELLSNNATIEIKQFDITTPWGKADVHGKAVFPPVAAKTESELDFLTNMQQEFDLRLEKKLALSLAKNFLKYFTPAHKNEDYNKQAMILLNNLEETKTIVSDDGNYKMHIEYKDKKLMLNNIPFSLSNKP
jgi:uncharacterized protein YdgA (DUF945 family)